MSGCSYTEGTNNINETKIKVTPSNLDFGYARPTDSPVLLPFEITNDSQENLVISSITSGCGCTVVEIPQEPILPGKTARAVVKINLFGKMGDFKNLVVIKTESHGIFSLNVRGVIETDIWSNESSIRCTATRGQKSIPFALTIHTKKYPDLDFDWMKLLPEITAKIVSRENRNDGEVAISLTGEVHIGEKENLVTSLNLKPTDDAIAPLEISIYCSREEDRSSLPQFTTSQINLGTLKRDQSTVFSVFGDPDIIQVICAVELKGVPEPLTIQLMKVNSQNNDELQFQLETKDAPVGNIEGSLVLKSVGNRTYTIPLFCEIQ